MRNWCGAAALSVFLASPLCAQQKAADDASSRAETAAEKPSEGTSNAVTNKSLAASKAIFALPAVPRPQPFPKPRPAGSKDSDAPGQGVPHYEFAVLYDYVNFHPGSPFADFNNHGASGSFTYNASRWLGLTAELGGYRFKDRKLGGIPFNGSIVSYLFGPRLNWRKFDYFVPFAEFLLGGSHAGPAVIGVGSQSSFSVATGGGVDMILGKGLAWRVAQLDYYMTNFSGVGVGGNARQDNFRAGTGLVYRWGETTPAQPPPPANRPPVAACSVNPTSVYAGSGDTVAMHINASDPDNDPLTYSYSATGGTVEGTGPDARWNSTGVRVGSYTVSVRVDDGKGGTASCSADIKVEEKPNHPPTANLAVEHPSILAGERTGIACNGTDPDNDPLTYSYTATGGQVTGTGSNVQFDSTGLQPGTYTVKCTVNDGRGGTADASGNVEVKEPPQVHELETKLALHSIYFPTAQPAEAEPMGGLLASQAATLNSLAADYQQYLKYRPAAHLILEGHADSRGAKEYNMKLSERRVERARSYLVEKGVPADHVEVKAFGFEKNMTSDEVKKLLDADSSLSPAEKQKLARNIDTVRMANNRRVDVTLSTTGEQSVRQFPFNAKDALTLLSRGGSAQGKAKAPVTKGTAPKAAAPKKP
ncbi:MAG TPA: OmpA family protein [Candidatus Acidoferrum sp.]|nr:OmpA family protein [Candidatus Acidoferrum sp.]